MKSFIAFVLFLTVLPAALAQYPKMISLTVTKITRTDIAFESCDNCGMLTTIEAHSATANFILTCQSFMPIGHAENNSVCAQMETGVYPARRINPELISFW